MELFYDNHLFEVTFANVWGFFSEKILNPVKEEDIPDSLVQRLQEEK